jgi:hypothetical protein
MGLFDKLKRKKNNKDIIKFMTAMCVNFYKSFTHSMVELGYSERKGNLFEIMLYPMWVLTDTYIQALKIKSNQENYKITNQDTLLIDNFNITMSNIISDDLIDNTNEEEKINNLTNFRNYFDKNAIDRYSQYKYCLNKWLDEGSVNKNAMPYELSCEFLTHVCGDDESWFLTGTHLIKFYEVCSEYFRKKLK